MSDLQKRFLNCDFMLTRRSESLRFFGVRRLVLVIALAITGMETSWAYKPEDPEVRAMVEKAIKYLEGLPESEIKIAPYGGGDAQVVLAAYAHFKAENNPDAPLVKLGLQNALQYVAKIKSKGGKLEHEAKTVYEIPVVIFLLADLDSAEYAEELKLLSDALFQLQNRNGGFGYPDWKTGDVSQVQYVALASWVLDRSGIEIPLDRVGSMLSWMMRVQDTSGAWPYQGEDPGIGRGLISQPREEMTVTMGLAGGGTALICSDIFRIWNISTVNNSIDGLPNALKPFDSSSIVEKRRKLAPVKDEQVVAAIRKMDAYRNRFPYKRTAEADWYYYMLYALERYESFWELISGESSTEWYDSNVKYLMGQQDSSGAWGIKDRSKTEAPVSTSFAILFLIRGTKKAIASLSTGTLAGGYGLPSDTTKILVNGTQIKGEPTTTAVGDLLNLLEADDANNVDGNSISESYKLEQDPARRTTQIDRLSRLVRGSQSWQARRVAARLLGQTDDLSVVPTLIFALSDPDKLVRGYASDGLNFISRKFASEVNLRDATPEQIKQIQKDWSDWYLTVRPGYQFIDGF